MEEFSGTIDHSIWDNWKRFEIDEQEPGFFLTLVEVFIEAVPADFTNLQTAILEQDLNRIFQLSHSLKSSCRSLGAMSLGDALEKMEIQARREMQPGSELIQVVRASMLSVLEQIETERQNLKAKISV